MKERPILFSSPMVRALLARKKRQTRRILRADLQDVIKIHDCEEEKDAIVTFAADGHGGRGWYVHCGEYPEEGSTFLGACPFGEPGDRLWVRETFQFKWLGATQMFPPSPEWVELLEAPGDIGFAADWNGPRVKWRPSIFMPRRFSRITMEVTDVRVERLTSICEEDAMAEGTGGYGLFASLWESIHGPKSWSLNPWVWAVSFNVLEKGKT